MRWFEVFASVLKRKGFNVQYGNEGENDWDGDVDKITVNGDQLWAFIEDLDQSRNDLLTDCIVLITQHFEERVKSFIQNILLGPGEEKVPIKNYSYRVEFQGKFQTSKVNIYS